MLYDESVVAYYREVTPESGFIWKHDVIAFPEYKKTANEFIIIGFSPATYDSSLSTRWAIENGLMRLALFLGVAVQDTTLYVQRGVEGTALQITTNETLVNPERILGISAHVRVLGIKENGSVKAVALGVDHPSFLELADGKYQSILSSRRPEWVDTISQTPGYVYDVGISPPWFNPIGGLEAAERNARRGIAQQAGVQVNSQGIIRQDSKTLNLNRETIILSDVRVLLTIILPVFLTGLSMITGCGKKDGMKQIDRVREEADDKQKE